MAQQGDGETQAPQTEEETPNSNTEAQQEASAAEPQAEAAEAATGAETAEATESAESQPAETASSEAEAAAPEAEAPEAQAAAAEPAAAEAATDDSKDADAGASTAEPAAAAPEAAAEEQPADAAAVQEAAAPETSPEAASEAAASAEETPAAEAAAEAPAAPAEAAAGGAKGEDFGKILADYEGDQGATGGTAPKVGDKVTGKILSINEEGALVDLGGKAEASVDIAELKDSKGELKAAVGETLKGVISKIDEASGQIVLRTKIGRSHPNLDELRAAFEQNLEVEGLVKATNKGGVEVDLAGMRAFCPISQIERGYLEDASPYVGQKLTFRITQFEEGKNRPNIVVSRRVLLDEEAKEKAAEIRANLKVGDVREGSVTSLATYGAFVDLGGIEGLLHVSQIGHTRVEHPKDVLSKGQKLDVEIIKIEDSDDPKKPHRISLSRRRLEKDPWSEAIARFPAGTKMKAKVVRLANFGAFVQLAPGVDGLLHVSKLGGGQRLEHPKEAVNVGDELEVIVERIEADKQRISLTLEGAPGEPSVAEYRQWKDDSQQGFGSMADFFKKMERK